MGEARIEPLPSVNRGVFLLDRSVRRNRRDGATTRRVKLRAMGLGVAVSPAREKSDSESLIRLAQRGVDDGMVHAIARGDETGASVTERREERESDQRRMTRRGNRDERVTRSMGRAGRNGGESSGGGGNEESGHTVGLVTQRWELGKLL